MEKKDIIIAILSKDKEKLVEAKIALKFLIELYANKFKSEAKVFIGKSIFEEIKSGDTVYRGHSADNKDPYINWHTNDKHLANEYASPREKSFIGIDKVKFKKSINLGHDRMHVSPAHISNQAIKQDDNKKYDKSHKETYDEFSKHFGKEDRPITDYWSTAENKRHTHKFLTKFGYDAIHIKEGKLEKDTIGLLSKQNTNVE